MYVKRRMYYTPIYIDIMYYTSIYVCTIRQYTDCLVYGTGLLLLAYVYKHMYLYKCIYM